MKARYIYIPLLSLFVAFGVYWLIPKGEAAVTEPSLSPIGPAKGKQTLSIPVSGTKAANPAIIWTQLDGGNFRATDSRGSIEAPWELGADGKPQPPHDSYFHVRLDMSPYQADIYYDSKMYEPNGYTVSKLSEEPYLADGFSKFTPETYNSEFVKSGKDYIRVEQKYAYFETFTGGSGYSEKEETTAPFGPSDPMRTTYGFSYKFRVDYPISMDLTWESKVKQNKILTAGTTKASLNVGETSTSWARIETTDYNASPAIDVNNSASTTTWKSDNSAVAEVNPSTGRITAKGKGTATITVFWTKEVDKMTHLKWHLYQSFTVTVGGGATTSPSPIPTPSSTPPPVSEVVCTPPSKVNSRILAAMNPVPTGKLAADSRGANKFDVSLGIPTSESLFANVIARNYLFDQDFGQYNGKCTYTVKVSKTYNLSWTQNEIVGYTSPVYDSRGNLITPSQPIYGDVEYTDTETVEKPYTVDRPYSYWAIDKLLVYNLASANLRNYALQGGSKDLFPNAYTPPAVSAEKYQSYTEHINAIPANDIEKAPQTIRQSGSRPSVPDENFLADVESEVKQVKVRNDKVTFNGIVMDNQYYDEVAPTPSNIPAAVDIDDDTLYESNLKIPNSLINKAGNPTTGTVRYRQSLKIGTGVDEVTLTVAGLNSVTVHTPVVNYSDIPDSNRGFDQSVSPDMSTPVLVHGRNFTISFSESGQHLNQLGYGNKSYTKYTGSKRVRIPFDVLVNGSLVTANTWITYPVGTSSQSYTVPTWVTEDNYTILTESWA